MTDDEISYLCAVNRINENSIIFFNVLLVWIYLTMTCQCNTSEATEATHKRMLQMDAASKAVDGSITCRWFDIYLI